MLRVLFVSTCTNEITGSYNHKYYRLRKAGLPSRSTKNLRKIKYSIRIKTAHSCFSTCLMLTFIRVLGRKFLTISLSSSTGKDLSTLSNNPLDKPSTNFLTQTGGSILFKSGTSCRQVLTLNELNTFGTAW